MTSAHFSSDSWDFIQLLDQHNVEYVLVGGEAVIHYGYVRLTGDVDFFYGTSAENVARLFSALLEFWSGEVPGVVSADVLAEPNKVFQYGLPPNRIDLLSSVSGISFGETWSSRQVLTADDGTTVNVISLEMLIRNKAASARPKDLDDIAFLEKAARKK